MPRVVSWTLFQYIWVQIPFQNKQVTKSHKFCSPQPLIVPRKIMLQLFWQGQGNKHSSTYCPPLPVSLWGHWNEKLSVSGGGLILFPAKRGKVTLQLSLTTMVILAFLRHRLIIVSMAKLMGECKWSAPHLLQRESEEPEALEERGLLQSRSDTALCLCTWSKYCLQLLRVKYYLLESNHCPWDAMSLSEQYL